MKQAATIIALMVLAFAEISIGGSEEVVGYVQLTLSAAILVSLIARHPTAIAAVLGAGIVFDLYSYLPFGIYMLAFLIVWGLVALLYSGFFSDFSLPSIIMLVLFATLLFDMTIYAASHILAFFDMVEIVVPLTLDRMYNLIWHIILNTLVVSIGFGIATRVSSKLNVRTLKGTKGLR